MQRRSILFYTYALTAGGAERVWALLSSGFAARGWDVTLAVDFDATENRGFVDDRVKVVALGRSHAGSVLRLARLLAAAKPDISISAMSASNLKHAAAARLAGRLSHAILSYHGYSTTEPQPLSRLGYLLAARLSRATAATVCVSDGLASHLVDHWRVDPAKAIRIYNPVSIGAGKPPQVEADLVARGPMVLASGRLIFYKNFKLLLRAFARVEVPGARLCLIGEGPERAALQSEILRLGLRDRVIMPGYAPEPWSHYREASCFVSSSDQEPFGLVVVEALAYGLPVVATACDGPREILSDARLGTLVAPGDEAALAQALTATLSAPGDPAPRIARAADFSLERALVAYEALFDRVLANSARAADAPVSVSAAARPTASEPIAQTPPRKLIFYTHALAGGGAERVWALLASGFARAGCDVILAVDFEADANRSFVDPAVRLIVLGGSHMRNVARLRALIAREAPDAILAALCVSNLKAAIAAARAGVLDRTILSYHGFFGSEAQTLSLLSYWLTPLLTRVAAATVAVSDGLRRHLVETWRGDRRRVARIYNPIECGDVREPSREELARRPPAVLAVGRLDKHKNFDLLVRAFAAVRPSEATLTILGEGPERERLLALVDELGLAARVHLVGYRAEPWRYYAQAKCLAVASGSEAFSLVVAEALAHGLAVVSTDCQGPREILADGRYGALTPIGAERELTQALSSALADPGDPAPRIARAKDFSLERALHNYGALIDRLPALHSPRAGAAALRQDDSTESI